VPLKPFQFAAWFCFVTFLAVLRVPAPVVESAGSVPATIEQLAGDYVPIPGDNANPFLPALIKAEDWRITIKADSSYYGPTMFFFGHVTNLSAQGFTLKEDTGGLKHMVFKSGYPGSFFEQGEDGRELIEWKKVKEEAMSSSTVASPATSDGERYPQTRTRQITEGEAAAMSYAELRYAINEMYARHGADFPKDPLIAKRFRPFTWYHPRKGTSMGDIEKEFSEIERANLEVLGKYRDQRRAAGER
jgi:hypothetical protein